MGADFPEEAKGFYLFEVKGVLEERDYEDIPEPILEEAVEWWLINKCDERPDRPTVEDCENILSYAEFGQSMTRGTDETNNTASVVDQAPQGETVEEAIALDALHKKIQPWIHHWREEVFGDHTPPFETVKASVRWIEDVAGYDKFIEHRKEKRYRTESLSPELIENNDDLPDLFPAIIPSRTKADVPLHDLQIDDETLNKPPTSDDKELLDQLREREKKAWKEQEEYYRQVDEQDGFEAPDWTPLKTASGYFKSDRDLNSTFEREVEMLASITGFSEVSLILHVLTPHKPAKTRYSIIQHKSSGSMNRFGWFEDYSVTIKLQSPDITGEELKEDILKPAKKHLNSFGDKHLDEHYRKMWNLYHRMGGPEEYGSKKQFWKEFKARWDETYSKKNGNKWDTWKRKFNKLQHKLEDHHPGILQDLTEDSTT